VSFPVSLWLVLLAAFGLIATVLSGVVVVAWRSGLDRVLTRANEVYAVRLLPAAGAGFVALGLVLPSFLINEPAGDAEQAGWLLPALAVLALAMFADGVRRGSRAWWATWKLQRRCRAVSHRTAPDGRRIDIIDSDHPIVAVVGAWRPRILAAHSVVAACSAEEFAQVVSHESAHVSARDNLKLLIQLVIPDLLGWLPTGRLMSRQWKAIAELEADQRAAGGNAHDRVTLAAALVKVARLAAGPVSAVAVLTMPIVGDEVEQRVRRLLEPSRAAPARWTRSAAVVAPALLLCGAPPFYAVIHRAIEVLVVLGR
jgi:beta-lactamase regulating signal transducer with metallopeptidase domain